MPTPIVSIVAVRLTRLSSRFSGLVVAASIALAVAALVRCSGVRISRRSASKLCFELGDAGDPGFGFGRGLGRLLGDSFFLERHVRGLGLRPPLVEPPQFVLILGDRGRLRSAR